MVFSVILLNKLSFVIIQRRVKGSVLSYSQVHLVTHHEKVLVERFKLALMLEVLHLQHYNHIQKDFVDDDHERSVSASKGFQCFIH